MFKNTVLLYRLNVKLDNFYKTNIREFYNIMLPSKFFLNEIKKYVL